MICMAWSGSPRQLTKLAQAAVILGCGCALLGMVQILTDGGALPYPENPMPGVAFGTFANRNSTGLFLDCCLILLAVLPWRGLSFAQTGWRIGAAAILAVAVVLTQSRTSLLLLCIPAGLAMVRFIVWLRHEDGTRRFAARFGKAALIGAGVLACGAAVATAMVAARADRVESVLARFGQDDARRPAIWEDAAFSARRFWPVGAGMGTFDEVFQIDESLEYLSPRTAGRAHNDFLEIAIEAGLPGLALVAGWIVWCLVAAARARGSPHRWLAWGATGMLAAIASQSLLDYPLRNQTLLCMAALAIAMLAAIPASLKGNAR
ncbi:MAG: O-antigen ligase family protein [Novosphingobium sp.]|nr:O-antigen ligase family protein [Novosphingobium sp.]